MAGVNERDQGRRKINVLVREKSREREGERHGVMVL